MLAYALRVKERMRSAPTISQPWQVIFGLLALGCGSSREPAPVDAGPPDAEPVPVSVEIGVPGGADGLEFAPLAAGGELRLQSFGQGGTHVFLAVRCIGFGSRAFVSLTLTNELTQVQVFSPTPVRPQLLYCREPTVCDLVPILAMTGGLTEPDVERDGLAIQVAVEVHNQAGLSASATQEAVLSTADL
jgi:hypothetical protein